MNDRKVALVVGSGSVKCAAALGLWKALHRHGVEVDLLVGCSGGSLYTTVMALGLSIDECIESTLRLWNRQITQKRNLPALLSAVLPRLVKFDERFSMIDDRPMLSALQSVFGEKTFADAQVPLHIVATDFHSGEQVVLSQGKLVDAIRASISIPFIWPAWPLGENLLVDGSLSSPLPVDVAIREGAEIILAMGFESPSPRKVKSVSRFAFHLNSIMTNNLLRANYAFHNLAHHAEIITVIPEFDRTIGLFDTDQFPYVIAQGERAMEEQIDYLLRLLSVPLTA